MRLQILPALRRLWRARGTMQLGVGPHRATTLEFPDPAAAGVLGLLDGTRDAHQVAREGNRFGLPAADVLALVDSLCAAGVVADRADLTPADLPEGVRRRLDPEIRALSLRRRPGGASTAGVIRRRRRSRVLVSGRGRMVATIGAMLGAAGVGRLELDATGTVGHTDLAVGGLLPSDLGRPRSVAAADAVRRVAPGTTVGPLRSATPDLAILVGVPRPDPVAALRYARRRCPHLTVWLRDGVVALGPLVRPGSTACLDCLELHRQGRDPAWPLLAAQLAAAPDDEPVEATVAALGAALAARHALCQLDGGTPDSVGGTLEVTPVGPVRRRRWPPHPRCGCLRRSRAWTMAG